MRTGGAEGRALAAGAGVTGVSAPEVSGMARATELLLADEVEALFGAGLHPARTAQAASSTTGEADDSESVRGIVYLPLGSLIYGVLC